MTLNKLDINPADDHSPRWDVDITEANKKLASIGSLQPVTEEEITEEKPTTITKEYAGGKIKITPKAQEEYSKIWNEFVSQSKDFENFMGYGVATIEKIGKEDFVDFMGWDKASDVGSWSSNALHVIPCIHCEDHFTTYEQDFGLCPECQKLYDIQRLSDTVTAYENNVAGGAGVIRAYFVIDKEFRERYLIKTDDVLLEQILNDGFTGMDTYRYLKNQLITDVLYYYLLDKVNEKPYPKETEQRIINVFSAIDGTDNVEEKLKEIFLKEAE